MKTLPGGEGESLERLVAVIEATATALAGPNAEESRQRFIAREVGRLHAKALLLETMMDQAIARGDDETLTRVHRAWAGTRRALADMLAEHRHAHALARRPVAVAVGTAQNVTIRAGGR